MRIAAISIVHIFHLLDFEASSLKHMSVTIQVSLLSSRRCQSSVQIGHLAPGSAEVVDKFRFGWDTYAQIQSIRTSDQFCILGYYVMQLRWVDLIVGY
jgi:hypothetical protein